MIKGEEILKELVSRPSFVRDNTNEVGVVEYVEQFLRQNCPWLTVARQYLADGHRYNILATSEGKPQLILFGHLDTVDSKPGWQHNQFGELVEDRYYGLGAYDMKGGVAAILSAVAATKEAQGLTVLLYVDEEYDFSGMKQFVKNGPKIVGELAVVAEPTNETILAGCRGLIELLVEITGRTAHAARPSLGLSAIDLAMGSINDVKSWLDSFFDQELGRTTSNVAAVTGGLVLPGEGQIDQRLGTEGNNIADYARYVFEVRTTSPQVNAQSVIKRLEAYIKQAGGVAKIKIKHDLGSLNVNRAVLNKLEKAIRQYTNQVEYANAAEAGYTDGQMLQQRYHIPVVQFGPNGEGMHSVDEWVSVSSVERCAQIFACLIRTYSNQ